MTNRCVRRSTQKVITFQNWAVNTPRKHVVGNTRPDPTGTTAPLLRRGTADPALYQRRRFIDLILSVLFDSTAVYNVNNICRTKKERPISDDGHRELLMLPGSLTFDSNRCLCDVRAYDNLSDSFWRKFKDCCLFLSRQRRVQRVNLN